MSNNPKAYTVELTRGDTYDYKVDVTLSPGDKYATPTFFRIYRKDVFEVKGFAVLTREWVRMDIIPQRLVVEFFQFLSALGEENDI